MAVVKKISELTAKGSNIGANDLVIVGVSNGTDYDLKSVTGNQLVGAAVAQTITSGVTTTAPSQDAVKTALDLKVDKVVGSRLITTAEGTILGNTSGTNTNDETVSTIKSKLGITTLSGSNTGDQTLQQVSNLGADTTVAISSSSALYRGTLSNATIQSATLIGGVYTSIDADGKIQVNTNGSATGIIKATNLANIVTLEIPNKAVGSYTIATTTDLTSKVDSNTAITGATKTKITYDSKGLITSGADATTADIADSSNKRYVTDANLTIIGNTSGTNTGDQTFLNARVQTVTSSATVTPVSTNDLVIITAQAAGLTLANPTGTFTEGQALMIRIKDNGTAKTIAFDTNYRAIGVTIPTTTVASKTMYVGIIYNATDGKWDILGTPTQG